MSMKNKFVYLKRKQLYSVRVLNKKPHIEGVIFIKARSIKKAMEKVKKYGDFEIIEVRYEKQ